MMTHMQTARRETTRWWLLSIAIFLVLLVAGYALLPRNDATLWLSPIAAGLIAATAVSLLRSRHNT